MSTTFHIEQENIEAAKQYLEEHLGIPALATYSFTIDAERLTPDAVTYTVRVELNPLPLTPKQARDILKLLGGESL